MKIELTNRNHENECLTARARKPSPFLQLAGARRRQVRITVSHPRREVCLTKRALLAALREAESAEWLASGGDYLSRTHQTQA